MLMVINLKNNKYRIINITILFIIIMLFILLFVLNLNIPCAFKSAFGISCPGCGMTRAGKELLKLDFQNAYECNVLAIPLALCLIVSFFLIINDIIKNTNNFLIIVNKVLSKYWYVFAFLVLFSLVINNIRGI